MNKSDMQNEVFAATAKLELMQTALDVLIKVVESEETNSYLMASPSVVKNFLYVALDNIQDIINILDKVQKGGAE